MVWQRLALVIIIIAGLIFMLRTGPGIVSASERETELFNKGYEYLLSYKPDQAAETFRLFLKEFPESSARDAAMFWLAKTLISMKLYGEAELTFQTIQKEFPDSPFIVFIAAEREEIAKVRSAAPAGKAEETTTKIDSVPKETKDSSLSQETDGKLTQLLKDKEKAEALLQEERRTNQARMLRIADLESRDSDLKKQNADLEDQVRRLADIEKNLKEVKYERDQLIAQVTRLSAEKGISGKDSEIAADRQTPEQKAAIEGGEALRFRLAQLEMLSEEQGKELAKVREEQQQLKKLLEEEKKYTAGLSADLVRSNEREKNDKTQSQALSAEKLTGDAALYKSRLDWLQIENKGLTNRIEELESQAEQRIRDMRILNSYLSSLMFQKRGAPKPQTDPKVAEEMDRVKQALEEEKKGSAKLRGQLADLKEQRKEPPLTPKEMPPAPQLTANPSVMAGKRPYTLSEVVDYQTNAALLFRKLELKDPVWRAGDPLNDFIAEELLLREAAKAGIKADPMKKQKMVERYTLGTVEADYLGKLLIIAGYIDTLVVNGSSEQWIDIITVNYKSGSAIAKTIPAAELQKAARGGKSFEEIEKMHPEAVKFSRLSSQEFSTTYKSRSQVIQKLNAQNEEMLVFWSDKGYMLIKLASGHTPFDPFIEMKADEKEKVRSLIKSHIDELKKKT